MSIQGGNVLVKELVFNESIHPGIARAGHVDAPDSRFANMVEETASKDKLNLADMSTRDKEEIEEELQRLNKNFTLNGKYLKFKFDEESETSYVEVINATTHEVIVSLPPEFLIDLSVKMKKILGMYIDEKL